MPPKRAAAWATASRTLASSRMSHCSGSAWPPAASISCAALEIEAAGGQALPLQCNIREEASVLEAVTKAVTRFGGIDILVNNASAISLTPTPATPMKRFDLMFGVNVRGTYLCTQLCLPWLKKAAQAGRNPHVLNLSPPLSMREHWFAPHVAYTMAKYGMSECTLGHAGEFRRHGIGVNSLWPRTAIATAALQMIPGIDLTKCRTPEILADAAYLVLTSDARSHTGQFHIDDTLLRAHGVTDLERYSVTPCWASSVSSMKKLPLVVFASLVRIR